MMGGAMTLSLRSYCILQRCILQHQTVADPCLITVEKRLEQGRVRSISTSLPQLTSVTYKQSRFGYISYCVIATDRYIYIVHYSLLVSCYRTRAPLLRLSVSSIPFVTQKCRNRTRWQLLFLFVLIWPQVRPYNYNLTSFPDTKHQWEQVVTWC